METSEYFTLCAFPRMSEYKKALGYLGSKSGRDEDKIAGCGFAAIKDGDALYFSESSLVFVCRTLYHAPLLESGFVDKGLVDFNYSKRDFHEMYVGEIVKVLADK